MTTSPQFSVPPPAEPLSTGIWTNGRVAASAPKHRRAVTTSWPARPKPQRIRTDPVGQMLILGACVLLAGLAVAMGITSFHAQFTYIFATKRQWGPALLEALGLDAGAVIFSLLGIALARLGRRAAVERVLVVICALGSCGMNVLNANLGSPRSVAVYAMPPALFALTSDRLISVVRRAALGTAADGEAQRSAWYLAGRSLLYGLRFAVDRRGTARGLRQAVLEAAPLPQPAIPAVPGQAHARAGGASPAAGAGAADYEPTAYRNGIRPAHTAEPGDRDVSTEQARSHQRNGTKTARFLALAEEEHGPLSQFDLSSVYRISAELAPRVRLNAGSARAALRAAVMSAQDGAR